jgi:hypothetical protein
MSGELASRQQGGLLDDLKKLDESYCELSKQEESLTEVLHRLQQEERVLQLALKEASETGTQRMQQERRDKDATAILRLEQALMESSSSEDEEGNAPDFQSLASVAKTSVLSANHRAHSSTERRSVKK